MNRNIGIGAVALSLGAAAIVGAALVACDSSPQADAMPPVTGTHQQVASQRCEEDMACWDCRTMGNQVCGHQQHTKPRWLDCNIIEITASYEFPHLAYLAYRQCMRNAGTWQWMSDHLPGADSDAGERFMSAVERHKFQWVGDYDRHHNVWAMVGPTTVFVTRGWFETS